MWNICLCSKSRFIFFLLPLWWSRPPHRIASPSGKLNSWLKSVTRPRTLKANHLLLRHLSRSYSSPSFAGVQDFSVTKGAEPAQICVHVSDDSCFYKRTSTPNLAPFWEVWTFKSPIENSECPYKATVIHICQQASEPAVEETVWTEQRCSHRLDVEMVTAPVKGWRVSSAVKANRTTH